jgi:hypothetical protein
MNFESDVRLCIVGSACAEKEDVLPIIERYIDKLKPAVIISGQCHLGGVDEYVEEEASFRGIPFDANPAKRRTWKGKGGFKERNERMALKCTHLVAIMSERSTTYGSGWTADFAESIGKKVYREKVP